MGGVAMKFMADKFVGGDTGKIEDFLLSANPETLQALKVAEIEFKRDMAELNVNLEELEVKDREGARDLAKEKGLAVQATISAVYSAGYFGIFYMFISGAVNIPPEHVGLVSTLLGALSAAQLQIMNFWFGSSRGSKEKTAILAKGT